MTSSRFVRGTKGRLFACLGALTVFAGVIFLYHSTRVELDEVRNGASKCRQEQESLAAQLQVIFEYKKRLEKSLQQEKADHRQTKEELQSRMNDEQQLRDKENLENVNKYTALQQQYKLLQSQHEDLSEKLAKIQSSRDTCEENLHRQQTQTASMQQQLATKERELEDLKAYKLKTDKENKDLQTKLSQFESELIKTRKQVQDQKMEIYAQAEQQKRDSVWKNKTSSTKEVDTGHIEDSAGGNQGGNIAPPQRAPPAAPSSSLAAQIASKHSTTPQINPEAVQSQKEASPAGPAPHAVVAAPQAAVAPVAQDSNSNGPQGVLPAPIGYNSENANDHDVPQQGAVPLQAPYKPHLHQSAFHNQEAPANQGQMPPIAPIAAVQGGVLPPPPEGLHDFESQFAHLPQVAHANMHSFQSDMVGFDGSKTNKQISNPHDTDANKNIYEAIAANHDFGLNNAGGNLDDFGKMFGVPHLANKHFDAHDDKNPNVYRPLMNGHNLRQHDLRPQNGLPQDNAFDKPPHVYAAAGGHNFEHNQGNLELHHGHGNHDGDVNQMVPLEGDVIHHEAARRDGVRDHDHQRYAGVGNHLVHPGILRQNNVRKNGAEEMPNQVPFNYQNGEYDREEHQAHGEEDDDDVDQIDYNEGGNQAQPAPKAGQRRFAPPQHHQDVDGVMVNPR